MHKIFSLVTCSSADGGLGSEKDPPSLNHQGVIHARRIYTIACPHYTIQSVRCDKQVGKYLTSKTVIFAETISRVP